jgi:hypothetical protein
MVLVLADVRQPYNPGQQRSGREAHDNTKITTRSLVDLVDLRVFRLFVTFVTHPSTCFDAINAGEEQPPD